MRYICFVLFVVILYSSSATAQGPASNFSEILYNPGTLKAIDSRLKVQAGDEAPDFQLPSLGGGVKSLRDYRGHSNVVLSFVPAAWTPVCSGQWPGYNIAERKFRQSETVLLGITVDNIPTLHAWVEHMGGLWFDVLSDFWPHGETAAKYGVLRSDGTTERALVYINKEGIITAIQVVDINVRPPLEDVFRELEKFAASSGK
ncbi:MAG: redoxin domain-containing protein [Desulfopila sp.]|nr:redoxin domain-containing protein [Desulfopila sp.]